MLTEAKEARNVCVAVAIDGFNPYGMMAAPYSCWPVFVIPLNPPPRRALPTQEHILVLDNSWAPREQNGCVHGAYVG